MQDLLDRRRRLARKFRVPEEVLRGSVFVRMLRCGKSGCRCASGDGHRAAYLSVTHPGGHTEQISLPAHLLPVAKRWVANYVKWWKAIERISSINRQLLRSRRDAEHGVRNRSGNAGRKKPGQG